MGTGYTRNDTDNNIADGNVINAADFDGEFDAIVTALSTSGHTHDGTAAEGGPVSVIGPAQDITVSATIVSPKSNNAIDLGTDALEFKDLYLDGTAYIDGLGRDLLVAGTNKIQFTNTSNYIHSASAGNVDLVAATEIHLTATTVNVDGLVDISGNLSVGGNFDVTGTIDFSDSNITNAGTIGLDSIFGDADSNTSITFSGSDVITIANAGTNQVTFNDGSIVPVTDSDVDLGTTSLRFKDTYVDSVTVTGEVAAATLDISGDIDIDGTANLDVVDIDGAVDMASTLQVDGVATFTGRDIHSGGITIANAGQIGSVGDTDAIAIASDGVVTLTQKLVGTELDISGNIDVDGTTNLDVVDIDGAVDMASTLAVTGIATFTDDIIIGDGKTIGSASDVDAIAIGADGDVTLTQDLELQHDGATISFGTNDEITVTHVHDTGLTFTNTNTGDNKPIVLQLKSEENEITANETIGSIEFAAGDDSGTDAATVAAGIHAIAEAEFTSSVNSTKLVFTTGASETAAASATAKMTLSSAGLLTIADDFMLKDGGTIGVASTNDAITIASTGIVTFKDDILIKDGGTIGVATTAGAITIASDGDTTFNADVNVGANFDVTGNAVIDGTALVTGVLTTTAATVFNGGFASNAASTITDDLSITGATPTFQMADTSVSNNVMDFVYDETFLIDIDPNNARGSTAFQIDQDGTQAFKIDSSRNAAFAGTVTANAGVVVDNFTLDGTTLALSSGHLTFDVAGDIILDADSANWRFKDDGTSILEIGSVSSGPSFYSAVSNAAMLFKGNDGGSPITALTLDMSAAGAATFNANVGIGVSPNSGWVTGTGSRQALQIGFGSIAGRLNDLNTEISNNAYAVTTGTSPTWAGMSRHYKQQIEFDNSGNIKFNLAPTVDQSTFDSSPNFTWTEAMTIDASGNIIIANTGGTLYTDTAGSQNLRLGENAGDAIASGGNFNVFAGYNAGTANTIGDENVAIGHAALATNVAGSKSTAIGQGALNLQNKASDAAGDQNNTAVGYHAGVAVTTGTLNTYVGASAGAASQAVANNTAVGAFAFDAGTGADNTAVGSGALGHASNSAANNVAVGHDAGTNITSGHSNTLLGTDAGDNISSGDSNIIIGNGIDAASATADGQLNIGGWIQGVAGKIGIGTAAPDSYLANELVVAAADEGGITLAASSTGHKQNIFFADGTSGSTRNRGNLSYDHGIDQLTMGTAAGNARFIMDSTGAVTMPSQPAFLFQPASQQDNVGSDVTVVFATERFDQNSDFASSTFTAPVAGKYQFNVILVLTGVDVDINYYQVSLVTSNRTYLFEFDPDFGQDAARWTVNFSILADMAASHTALVKINFSPDDATSTVDVMTSSSFSGYLVA